ncbi:MAG: hypothetical protein ABIG20_01215 [archaeon]
MILGFKEIYGFTAMDSNGKKLGKLFNVIVDAESEDAYFYLSSRAGTMPLSGLAKKNYFASINKLGSINHSDKTLKFSASAEKLNHNPPAASLYDHLTFVPPAPLELMGIHEGTRVYDARKKLSGVVYDYLLDNELGKRIGIVIVPLKELHTSVNVKPRIKPGTTYAADLAHLRLFRNRAHNYIVIDQSFSQIKWISGVPDYSSVESSAPDNSLATYIDGHLKQGYSPEDIEASLIEAGWDEKTVSEAIKRMGF